jgi:hypothetical protein
VCDQLVRRVAKPIHNARVIDAELGAWDLLKGKATPFGCSRSYGCGVPAGSCNLLLFRSATLGHFDLRRPIRLRALVTSALTAA